MRLRKLPQSKKDTGIKNRRKRKKKGRNKERRGERKLEDQSIVILTIERTVNARDGVGMEGEG